MLGWRADRGRAGLARAAAAVFVAAAVGLGTTACSSSAAPHGRESHVLLAARTRVPASAASVLAGAPDVVAEGMARRLFVSAPVVVVASADRPADLAAAARSARRSYAPLMLTSVRASDGAPGGATTIAVVSAVLRAQVRALDPRAVLAVGVAGNVLAAALPGIRVVTDPTMLPATKAPAPLSHLALLVHAGDSDAATLAAVTAARVTGVRVIAVRGDDPRADPAAIAALSAARPRQVLAVGAGFGPGAGWHPGSLSQRPGCSYPAAARSCSPCAGCRPLRSPRRSCARSPG